MRKIIYLLMGIALSTAAYAQQVNGSVKDKDGKPLVKTTISLLNAKDSSVAKLAVTRENGQFSFADIKPGNYLVSASNIGYESSASAIFEVPASGDVNLPALELSKASGGMKEVVVTAKKPMVEVKADKTILNVEGTINAVGTDALELLRKSPGVLVDKDDNLSLSGKNGVQVYIDGRPTPLAGKDLSDYLKSLQSNQIEAIEIITNPSAKYDAAGNAGIINIRLKKNKSFGTNGSVTTGYNIGIFPKYNAGLSLNHRNKKINVFGNYNYNNSKNRNTMNLYRIVLDTLFDQRNKMTSENISHNFKAGMDLSVSRKSTFGLIVNGNLSEQEFASFSRTPIIYNPTKTVDRILVADNRNSGHRKNVNFNANYGYTDTMGRSLTVNADYGFYDIDNFQMQPNIYFDATGRNELYRVVYNMIPPTKIDIYSLKADWEQNFKKGKLGLGFKTSYVQTDNDFQRYNVFTNGKTLDTLRSNRFDYTENINAVYANYNRAFKGFAIQAGLRVENTTSKGNSSGFKQVGSNYFEYDSTLKREYTDFFPSAAITFNKNPMNQVSLSYSRRIDRPAYQDLNPFEFKLDEYSFQKGNTQLRPQYTNSFGLTHTYKYKLNTTLNYSHVNDIFSQLIDTADKSKSFITKKNLATQDIVSLNVSYPFMYKTFTSFVNINTYYSHFQADFGTGRAIDLDVVSFNVYSQNSLKFAKTWTGEISGFYTAPSIWQGTFESKAMWGVDVGIQKQLMKGKANIRAAVSDIFRSMRWAGISNFAGQYMDASGRWESRQFKLNFTYRFGSTQVKAARQRNTGAEDENKRVQNAGGGIGQ
ncbi:MAG TPA: TonB-dependent receptor [Flavisolibacter sp.]|nr:TonB-dependent receptor [Flavisolibacter sp.]